MCDRENACLRWCEVGRVRRRTPREFGRHERVRQLPSCDSIRLVDDLPRPRQPLAVALAQLVLVAHVTSLDLLLHLRLPLVIELLQLRRHVLAVPHLERHARSHQVVRLVVLAHVLHRSLQCPSGGKQLLHVLVIREVGRQRPDHAARRAHLQQLKVELRSNRLVALVDTPDPLNLSSSSSSSSSSFAAASATSTLVTAIATATVAVAAATARRPIVQHGVACAVLRAREARPATRPLAAGGGGVDGIEQLPPLDIGARLGLEPTDERRAQPVDDREEEHQWHQVHRRRRVMARDEHQARQQPRHHRARALVRLQVGVDKDEVLVDRRRQLRMRRIVGAAAAALAAARALPRRRRRPVRGPGLIHHVQPVQEARHDLLAQHQPQRHERRRQRRRVLRSERVGVSRCDAAPLSKQQRRRRLDAHRDTRDEHDDLRHRVVAAQRVEGERQREQPADRAEEALPALGELHE